MLVIVPAVFELLFIGVLMVLLADVERKELTENRIKTILAESQKLTATFYKAGRAAVMSKLVSRESAKEQIENDYGQAMGQIAYLMDNIERNVHVLNPNDNSFEEIRTAALDGQEALRSLKERSESRIPRIFNMEYEKKLSRYIRLSEGFVQHEEQILSQKPQERIVSRRFVMGWIAFGVCLNVLIALALARYFNKEITRRLDTLMDNTFRLASRQPLHPLVGGGDEIAHLDMVFHQMSFDLDMAAKRKQEMVSMVSHDLRTPLMSMQTSLELLSEGVMGELPTKAREELLIADYNAARLIQLINDLLDIDKLEAGKFDLHKKNSDAGWILERCIRTVKAYADRHHVTILVPDEDDDVQIYGDPDRLAQIVTNLLSNAIKYSPEGGQVVMQYEETGDSTLIKVIDYGRGIPAGFEHKIFERFQQVDTTDEREKKGSGLGLAICKALVDAHNGSIGVQSKPGAGSTFWFKVPKESNTRSIKSEQNKSIA